MNARWILFTGLIAGALSAGILPAATFVFDENTLPTNPVNGFGAFTFDDFGAAGALTDGPDSIILDVVDSNASNGVFGGVGVDYVLETPHGSGDFAPQNFDASGHRWEMRLRILDNNEATSIRTTLIDVDGPGTADEHVYQFDLSGVPADGAFHLLTLPVDTPLFTQGAFGFSAGDGVVNPGFRQLQIQSEFGSTGRLNVEIDFVRIVPEPNSAFLLLLATTGAFRRCR